MPTAPSLYLPLYAGLNTILCETSEQKRQKPPFQVSPGWTVLPGSSVC